MSLSATTGIRRTASLIYFRATVLHRQIPDYQQRFGLPLSVSCLIVAGAPKGMRRHFAVSRIASLPPTVAVVVAVARTGERAIESSSFVVFVRMLGHPATLVRIGLCPQINNNLHKTQVNNPCTFSPAGSAADPILVCWCACSLDVVVLPPSMRSLLPAPQAEADKTGNSHPAYV